VHARLVSSGVGCWMDPAIVAFYAKRLTTAEFLAQRYRYGRSYAAAAPMTRSRRALLAAAAPAIVLLQLWRMTSLPLGHRHPRGHLARCLPLFVLSAVAWSIGESAGHLFGDGGASLEVR